MGRLLSLLDKISDKLLGLLCISLLICVVISTMNALIRKFLGISSNAFLEIQWTLYSLVFLYGGSVLLKSDDHIRIDILYDKYPDKIKNTFNIVMHSFVTLPILFFFLYHAFTFWLSSFLPFNATENWTFYLLNDLSHLEWSPNAGGLPTIFAKFLLPSAIALLILQTFSRIAFYMRHLCK